MRMWQIRIMTIEDAKLIEIVENLCISNFEMAFKNAERKAKEKGFVWKFNPSYLFEGYWVNPLTGDTWELI